MSATDVIVAVSTGWGEGARALVRATGADAHTRLSGVVAGGPEAGGRIGAARVKLSGGRWLPCQAVRFDGVRSFSGQDTLELIVPGSPLVCERVMSALCAVPGVREARPGEFSARAFLAGKMTLDQAEGIAALIAARSEDERRAADRVMSGVAGALYRAWNEETATLLALVEAGIDFTDQEDVVPIAPGVLADRLGALVRAMDEEVGGAGARVREDAQPRVVLAGPPNAGKSTLFNALLGRRRAVESPVAGTTRDALAEPLDLSRDAPGSGVVTLVDLAGLDDGVVSGESDGAAQGRAREEIAGADVVVQCDPAGRFGALEAARAGTPIVRVRTKADMLGAGAAPNAVGEGDGSAIAVCALDGWHLGALRRAIADAAWGGGGGGGGGSERGQGTSRSAVAAAVVPRHRRTLGIARARLAAALALVEPMRSQHALVTPELIAAEMRVGLDALGELAGAMSPDDIIGRVFATFCVGK